MVVHQRGSRVENAKENIRLTNTGPQYTIVCDTNGITSTKIYQLRFGQ